jgi:regulator of protease activity HflC (stomatin/prohibitin superfamily)
MPDDAAPATPPAAPELTGPVAASVAAAQLTQLRVPLTDAAEVLATPDALGRLPIVLLPAHALRIRNGPLILGVIAVLIGFVLDLDFAARGGLLALGGVLIVLGVIGSFIVPVPEGAQAVMLRSGRYLKTIGPGNKIVPPWIVVSHLVTTRETPFDAPSVEIPTRDDVRTNVDILLTFRIVAPEKFVFTISAPDFDQVCQATCQEHVRLLIRDKDADGVLDLRDEDAARLRAGIGESLSSYGIEVVRVVITHVMPPVEFVASRESRRLSAVLRAEESERHALELQRQADREDLRRHEIAAQREAIELEAANEVARLERLEARLREYPNAMRWDVDGQRLDVARGLATNTRAMVQVGPQTDVAGALLLHTLTDEEESAATRNGAPSTPAESPPDVPRRRRS